MHAQLPETIPDLHDPSGGASRRDSLFTILEYAGRSILYHLHHRQYAAGSCHLPFCPSGTGMGER